MLIDERLCKDHKCNGFFFYFGGIHERNVANRRALSYKRRDGEQLETGVVY